ncbi:DUF1289 domain-containing protein [Leptospira interrogans]
MDTPCIKVCVINPETRVCEGCYRTLAEIAQWSRLSDEQRRQIMNALPARRARQSAE